MATPGFVGFVVTLERFGDVDRPLRTAGGVD